jgi:hypothetical protein
MVRKDLIKNAMEQISDSVSCYGIKYGIIAVNDDITWQSTGSDCSKQAQRSSSPLSDIVTIQNTSMSIAAPNAPVNK